MAGVRVRTKDRAKSAANDAKIVMTESSRGPRLRRNWKTLTPNRKRKASWSAIVIRSKPEAVLRWVARSIPARRCADVRERRPRPAFGNHMIAAPRERGITRTLQLGGARSVAAPRRAGDS